MEPPMPLARARTRTDRLLDTIERAGNLIPHPTLLFVALAVAVLVLSALAARARIAVTHPLSGATVQVVDLLTADGLRRILTSAVTNFTGFAPLGVVLVAMLGIGVAERAGLIAALLARLVEAAPGRLLTLCVVLAAVLSSIAGDAGIVVLPPLAAITFQAAGRHPIAGLIATYVGVGAGFSANLLIGPSDALLAGISTEAVALVDPAYRVNAAGNWWFIIASTVLVTLFCSWITERVTEPRLGPWSPTGEQGPGAEAEPTARPEGRDRGLRAAGFVTGLLALLLLLGLVPTDGVLRDPATGSVLASPFMNGIVVVIALWAASAGIAYGYAVGTFRSAADVVEGMESTMRTLSVYLVLIFFAAQFVAWFDWTNLGVVLAVNGASTLQSLGLDALPLLVALVLLVALINLFLGSQSAKWAIMGPIFVPMFFLVGISPEATQMAYRIGDSCTNIITPLIPYLGLVVAIARRYEPRTGLGTLIAAMAPYSAALLVTWSGLLALWVLLDLPLGPGAPIQLPG
ncbi:MAG: AbgT family transporter [Pseudomonadales bacterium]|jgi:aminobenzoyl-glutamate transport protein|nr:AbgT family transporter [Pseudomonadales bacterium]